MNSVQTEKYIVMLDSVSDGALTGVEEHESLADVAYLQLINQNGDGVELVIFRLAFHCGSLCWRKRSAEERPRGEKRDGGDAGPSYRDQVAGS